MMRWVCAPLRWLVEAWAWGFGPRRCVATICLLTATSFGIAQPSITTATWSGNLDHQTEVTITGTSFGADASPLPLVYGDGEGCTLSSTSGAGWDPNPSGDWGESVSQQTSWDGGNMFCSNAVSSATHSTRVYESPADWPETTASASIGLYGSITQKSIAFWDTYADWVDSDCGGAGRFCCASTDSDNGTNLKSIRWDDATAGTQDLFHQAQSGQIATENCGPQLNPGGCQIPFETWESFEVRFDAGTVSTADMELDFWYGGSQLATSTTMQWYCDGSISAPSAHDVNFFTNQGTPTLPSDGRVFFDNLYFDNQWARVMLCEGSTWAARGQCWPQITTARSDTSITALVHKGRWTANPTRYLYVVDDSNSANANGESVTFGATSGGGASQGTQLDGVRLDGVTIGG